MIQTSNWSPQAQNIWQRMTSGGGVPGLANLNQVKGQTGRDILDNMMNGSLPFPPMNETMNMLLMEIGDGVAVFEGVPLHYHYNPMGTVHGGWFTSLLDSALGCAVQTTLPIGKTYTTVEIKVNFVLPATCRTGFMRAYATVIHRGKQIVTAEARIKDATGKVYAHASTSCFLLDLPSPSNGK